MTKDINELLDSYVGANFPILYINHFDFQEVDQIITAIQNGQKILEFTPGLGELDFKTKRAYDNGTKTLDKFLERVIEESCSMEFFILLKDVHQQLEDPNIIGLLKHITHKHRQAEECSITIFIVSNILRIPRELEDLMTIVTIPLPTLPEIEKMIKNFDIDHTLLGEFARMMKGLNRFQIEQILHLAYLNNGKITAEDRHLIINQKEQLIKKSGMLEIVPIKESLENDVGGLEHLKEWLTGKKVILDQLNEAVKFGVDIPKGMMIVGMPGCGKSLTAKATAQLFGLPLLRLDVGRLLGKYVGESEENMSRALKLSEAISPCVLWIDEIEKAFAGVGASGSGSDVTVRLFGQFLTWMQEKENTVFIVATANKIENIPPEFLRKGRFDELFFVDLPGPHERNDILKIHIKKRHRWHDDLNLIELIKATEGYNGADLEAVVKDAVEGCFVRGQKDLTTQDLLDSKEKIKSISESLKSQMKEIKKSFENIDLKPASKKEKDK